MQVKRFRARTIHEAMIKVKNDLGPNAMIHSTKKLDGDIGKQLFEIAAVPDTADPPAADRDVLNEVRSELVSIKDMVHILNHSAGMVESLLERPAALRVYASLIRNGVNARYAGMLVGRGMAGGGPSPGRSDDIGSRTTREMMKVVGAVSPFTVGGRKQIIGALVGTTGVGKTTTVAKLAAQLMLHAKRKVGLVSIDNYRIGALDQLKTYANILGVPCFPAFTREDLRAALERLESSDVVLIDTAGQSQYDMERLGELKRLMGDDLKISTHLLLSTATTEEEMHRTAINFGPLDFKSYIFTKIDESETCGIIVNQLMKVNRPISYITNGQNVPEDIEAAEPKRILGRLLRRR